MAKYKLSLLLLMVGATNLIAQTNINLRTRASVSNLFTVLDKYDTDASEILHFVQNKGKSLMEYFKGEPLMNGISTTVHEYTHSYTFYASSIWGGKCIYIAKGETINIALDEIAKSEKMARTIPANLRTFRYKTYISPGVSVSSNVNGIYGLLDEYNAYCQSMLVMYRLYPIYKQYAQSVTEWSEWISEFQNGIQAYAEFKYWMLMYLSYAKDNYPHDYQKIMNNENFWEAWRKKDRIYGKLIQDYLSQVESVVRTRGWTISNDMKWIKIQTSSNSWTSTGFVQEEAMALLKELQREKWQKDIQTYQLQQVWMPTIATDLIKK